MYILICPKCGGVNSIKEDWIFCSCKSSVAKLVKGAVLICGLSTIYKLSDRGKTTLIFEQVKEDGLHVQRMKDKLPL